MRKVEFRVIFISLHLNVLSTIAAHIVIVVMKANILPSIFRVFFTSKTLFSGSTSDQRYKQRTKTSCSNRMEKMMLGWHCGNKWKRVVRTALKCTVAVAESDVASTIVCESSSNVKTGWIRASWKCKNNWEYVNKVKQIIEILYQTICEALVFLSYTVYTSR